MSLGMTKVVIDQRRIIEMTDFEIWLHDFGYDHILRMLEIRRPGQYTPYEIDKKFSDQSLYLDNHFRHIQIKEAIELPDKDILIGFREIYDSEDFEKDWDESVIYYKKLSEIELTYFPCDDNIENWE